MVRHLLVVFQVLVFASCAAKTTRVALPLPPTRQEIWNATFSGGYFWEENMSVHLKDGRWEDESANGGLTHPYVAIIYDYMAMGDIDNDKVDEAIVVINQSGGGTGQFRHLVLFDRTDGKVTQRDAILIGDRVQVKSIHIEPGRLTAEIVDQGEMDGACCPGEVVRLPWSYSGGRFSGPSATVVLGKLYPAVLGSSTWKLQSWTATPPVPKDGTVTLSFADGQLHGNATCNQYAAPVQEGERHGTFSVGPISASRRDCRAGRAQFETQFLDLLRSSTSMWFSPDQLHFAYDRDGADGSMVFELDPK